jgi:hypothetical protein
MPQTFKVVETIVLPDGAGLDQLAEALMLLSDMAFNLEWTGGNSDSVLMVKLNRVAEEGQPDQASQIEAEEDEEPDQFENESEQAEEQQPSSSSRPKFRQFSKGTILPRPPSRPPPASVLAERLNEKSSQEKPFYQRLQPNAAFNVFRQPDDQRENEDPDAGREWHSSSWSSSSWSWKKRPSSDCHVCGKVRSEHQNKKFCYMSQRR